ncbi:MAG: hypothetical protein NVS1B13_17810 [Flavisolibacter sp.]
MTVTSRHTQTCFEAWINCENLLVKLVQAQGSFSKKIQKVVDQCAYICMGTFHALKTSSSNIGRFALLCIGICEECAEVCEKLETEEFIQVAKVCRECSASMESLAYFI